MSDNTLHRLHNRNLPMQRLLSLQKQFQVYGTPEFRLIPTVDAYQLWPNDLLVSGRQTSMFFWRCDAET